MNKIINLFLLFTFLTFNVKSQDTFENGVSPWQFDNNCPGNNFILGTAAGNGFSLPGTKSIYISWDGSSYGAFNSSGTCLAYRRYDNICLQSSLYFNYRINGILQQPITDNYYGLVVYSYDSINWVSSDTLRTGNCFHWYNKNINFTFNQSTVYLGFLYVQDVDSISICSPLAIDNVLLFCNTPLPIILSNFNITYDDCYLDVSFRTEAEINTKEFSLQYSTNALIWMDLCKFKGKGQSLTATDYHKNNIPFFPLANENYFRLCETDVLNNVNYYDIIVYSLINDCENNMEYYDILGRYYNGGLIKISKNIKNYSNENR